MNGNASIFVNHPRRWREFRYVYPVISRRSRGLSIGINLNPDGSCSFDCIYCCVDRTVPRPKERVNLATLEAELREIVTRRDGLFDEPEFRDTPPQLRRLNDIAFSGDGEPTAVAAFADAVRIAVRVRAEATPPETKLVLITNACYLTRPDVVAGLALFDSANGEIWAKLDAGTEAYFQRISRASVSLEHVLRNILVTARRRPIVIQSLFMKIDGAPPEQGEVAAYVARVRRLLGDGAQLLRIQVYTVARRTADRSVAPLELAALEAIGDRLRPLGVAVEVFA